MQKLLIVGLGNPGSQYINNRHNIGFMVLDALASHLGITFNLHQKFKSHIASLPDLILCKPTTFMNHSGLAVQELRDYYRLQDFLVIHDDLDLPLGDLRFKEGGGSGGHNGLKSIDTYCGNDYMRVRCGIGRPQEKSKVSSYVLSDFEETPKELLKISLEAILFFLKERDFVAMKNSFTFKGAK